MIGILTTTLLSFVLFFVIVIISIFTKGKEKKSPNLVANLILFIGAFIVVSIFVYFAMPTITVPNMIVLNVIVAFILTPFFYFFSRMDMPSKKAYKSPVVIILLVGLLAIPAIFIYGITALDESYQSIVKHEEEEAKPLSKDETPITVSPESARNKIQKAMSVVPNTQFYDLGKLQVQNVDGEVVYVAPVEFADLWKFFRGKVSEGYFTISATNASAQPKFVQSKMTYTNSSYFNKNVQRTIYNAHPTYIQSGEAQIEVDEEGKPWYVQSVYEPILLTNKPDMSEMKVAVVDPVSGNLSIYESSEAPEFIEGSISSEMASLENNYFGKYVHGWLNSLFGKRDVRIPNESGTESSVTPIFDEAGEMYYFTDLTSPKENIDSALGYTLIHARTGELTYYNGEKNNGIMDSEGAKQIVNKEFPEKNWEGSMPVLYNIDGTPTWIVNVLDPNGLFKQYAYISAADSDFVVFGDTANQALDAYRMQLMQKPGNVGATEEADLVEISGTVNRVFVTSTNEGQIVQFLIADDQTIYTINGSSEPLAIFLREGDEVQLQVRVRDDNMATVEEITIEGLTE